MSGDFQYSRAGLLDHAHLRFFTGSTILKLFLDAGYEPTMVDAIRVPGLHALAGAAWPLMDYLGLNRAPTVDQLDVYQHIVMGRPLEDAEPNLDDGISDIRGLRVGRRQGDAQREELFDVREDARQSRNLAEDPARQSDLERMQATLNQMIAGPLTPQRFSL